MSMESHLYLKGGFFMHPDGAKFVKLASKSKIHEAYPPINTILICRSELF